MYRALTIAGSDSVGGAGVQADLKAFASLGVHGCSAITALTAQNTVSVDRIETVSVDMIRAQLKSVLDDVEIGAAKTGMLFSPEIVDVVLETFTDLDIPLVVDPVMVAGVGDSLSSEGLTEALRSRLVPVCTLVTPNLYEAEVLANTKILNEDDAMRACEIIGREGNGVYLKGGHMDSEMVVDMLYYGSEFLRFQYPRLPPAGHGGGCTLSAFITGYLAKGNDLISAVRSAREDIQSSIATMYTVGRGVKVTNPMIAIQRAAEAIDVVEEVSRYARSLIHFLPPEWIPEKGCDLAFALPVARGPHDVALLETRIVKVHDEPWMGRGVTFGEDGDFANIVLSAMRHDPKMRAAMSVRFDRSLIDTMEEMGLTISPLSKIYDEGVENTDIFYRKSEYEEDLPDVVFEYDKPGKESIIVILGHTPGDVFNKISLLL
ncbi:MAG: hydroxymethylpyrimidine kinase / phosphomethylpyrimidine kinase / thiamine-phosphate diphosphorylase [Candidatus Methanomethylophilaceae archaeon]|nr:hydroxymethylpyrimidine kinase / phosphomethylpyrimidine kinase / thiamine-phosphate diphosphorylase [Candidatus Methanomethylophilaceae archaeon]